MRWGSIAACSLRVELLLLVSCWAGSLSRRTAKLSKRGLGATGLRRLLLRALLALLALLLRLSAGERLERRLLLLLLLRLSRSEEWLWLSLRLHLSELLLILILLLLHLLLLHQLRHLKLLQLRSAELLRSLTCDGHRLSELLLLLGVHLRVGIEHRLLLLLLLHRHLLHRLLRVDGRKLLRVGGGIGCDRRLLLLLLDRPLLSQRLLQLGLLLHHQSLLLQLRQLRLHRLTHRRGQINLRRRLLCRLLREGWSDQHHKASQQGHARESEGESHRT